MSLSLSMSLCFLSTCTLNSRLDLRLLCTNDHCTQCLANDLTNAPPKHISHGGASDKHSPIRAYHAPNFLRISEPAGTGNRTPAKRGHPFAATGKNDGFAAFAGLNVESPAALNPGICGRLSAGAKQEVDCFG